jgi:hypothetical protein
MGKELTFHVSVVYVTFCHFYSALNFEIPFTAVLVQSRRFFKMRLIAIVALRGFAEITSPTLP